MTDYLAIPPVRALEGRLRVPSSKSATNRALVLAALGGTPVEIVRPLESDDTVALRRCLSAMGARFERTADGWRVAGPLGRGPGGAVPLDVADSGTAARFLTAVCAAVPGRFSLTGSARLCERPIGELVEALSRRGARIACAGADGRLPLEIEGGYLASGEVRVDASRSSQFLSALLLAAVAVEGGLTVAPSGPVASAPYVGMTLEALREFGHEAEASADGSFRVRRGPGPAARSEVPGDYSSAVPLLAALAVAGGRLVLEGLRWPSLDADAGALPVLERMGLAVDGQGRHPERLARLRSARSRRGGRDRFPGRRPVACRGGCARPRDEPIFGRRPPASQGERPARGARSARRLRGRPGGDRGRHARSGRAGEGPALRRPSRDAPRPPDGDVRGNPLASPAGTSDRRPGLRREVLSRLLSRPRAARRPLIPVSRQ